MSHDGITMIELDSTLTEVATARRFVRSQLVGVPEGVGADAQLIASELVTNAIEHGVASTVHLAVRIDDDAVDVTVESIGPSSGVGTVDAWTLGAADEIGGRGLGIVKALADDVSVTRSPARIAITARLTI